VLAELNPTAPKPLDVAAARACAPNPAPGVLVAPGNTELGNTGIGVPVLYSIYSL
jgi:hypothetical protein